MGNWGVKMGQEEILNFLSKKNRPMSRGQIAIAMKEDPIKVSHQLNKLLKFGEIECVEIDAQVAKAMYKCCRRMFLYYTK